MLFVHKDGVVAKNYYKNIEIVKYDIVLKTSNDVDLTSLGDLKKTMAL